MNIRKLALARYLKEDPMSLWEIKEDRFVAGGSMPGYHVWNKAEFLMSGRSITEWDGEITYEGTHFYILREI